MSFRVKGARARDVRLQDTAFHLRDCSADSLTEREVSIGEVAARHATTITKEQFAEVMRLHSEVSVSRMLCILKDFGFEVEGR